MLTLQFKDDFAKLIAYLDRLETALGQVADELPEEFARYLANEMQDYIERGGTMGKTGGEAFPATHSWWRELMAKPWDRSLIWSGRGVSNIRASGAQGVGFVHAPEYLAEFSPSSGYERLTITETFLIDENGHKVPDHMEAEVRSRIKRLKIYDLDNPVQRKTFWKRYYKRGFTQPVMVKKTIERMPRDWARLFPEDIRWAAHKAETMLKDFGGMA